MCLILLAWQVHPDYPLVVAANRDEFFQRPAAPAGFWPDAPSVFAGRDLEAGGSWLGITRQLGFAALTNYREGRQSGSSTPSRGELVAQYLLGPHDPEAFLDALSMRATAYNGFNLLVGDAHRLAYFSNRGAAPRALPPGIYGLSNHLLDTLWPKLAAARAAFGAALGHLPEPTPFFDLLADDEIVPDKHLPETGVPLAWERILSAIFVRAPHYGYGTRASTLILRHRSGSVSFIEHSFGPDAVPLGQVCETFYSEISTGV